MVKRALRDARRPRPFGQRSLAAIDLVQGRDLARFGNLPQRRNHGLAAPTMGLTRVARVDRREDSVVYILLADRRVDRLRDVRVRVPHELRHQLDRHREIHEPLPGRPSQVVGRDDGDALGDASLGQLLPHTVEVAEELPVLASRVLPRVGEQHTLLVGDDGNWRMPVIVLGPAHEDLDAAREIGGDVCPEGVVQGADLRPGGERERRRSRRVGREVREDSQGVGPRDRVALWRRGRREIGREEEVQVAGPEPARFRHRQRHPEHAQFSLDRAVGDAARTTLHATAPVDIHPCERRVAEAADRAVVSEHGDQRLRLRREEGDVLRPRASTPVVEQRLKAVVQRLRGGSVGISGLTLPLGKSGPSRFLVRRAGAPPDDPPVEVVVPAPPDPPPELEVLRPPASLRHDDLLCPLIRLLRAQVSQTSTGTRSSSPLPTSRPAAARRYSCAFDREHPRAASTSRGRTHAAMPAGACAAVTLATACAAPAARRRSTTQSATCSASDVTDSAVGASVGSSAAARGVLSRMAAGTTRVATEASGSANKSNELNVRARPEPSPNGTAIRVSTIARSAPLKGRSSPALTANLQAQSTTACRPYPGDGLARIQQRP